MSKYLIFCMLSLIKVTLSKIYVDFPEVLNKTFSSGIDMNVATFGDIPYGTDLYGKVYYDTENTDIEMACKDLAYFQENFNFESQPILMVDRGSCSFVTKARNAQNIGAKAIVIINNNEDDINDIYMIDDGTGMDISIPAILISNSNGNIIKDYINKNKSSKISFIINFELQKSKEINFEIIFSSTNLEIYTLLNQLKDFLSSLEDLKGENVFNFYPIYFLQSHPDFQPIWRSQMNGSPPSPVEIDDPDCYSNGHYCNFLDFESVILNSENGRRIIKQDLRQICIFKERDSVNINEFISYTTAFYDLCLNGTQENFKSNFTDVCAIDAMRFIGYDDKRVDEIENCIKSSFNNVPEEKWGKEENTILKKEKKFLRRMRIQMNPSIIVNKKLIYVNLFILGKKNFS